MAAVSSRTSSSAGSWSALLRDLLLLPLPLLLLLLLLLLRLLSSAISNLYH
jgi:hypothetical protein